MVDRHRLTEVPRKLTMQQFLLIIALELVAIIGLITSGGWWLFALPVPVLMMVLAIRWRARWVRYQQTIRNG